MITLNDDDGNLCTEVCFPNDISVALATFVIADQVNVQLVENLEEHNGDDAGDGSEQSTGSPANVVLKMVTLMLFFSAPGRLLPRCLSCPNPLRSGPDHRSIHDDPFKCRRPLSQRPLPSLQVDKLVGCGGCTRRSLWEAAPSHNSVGQ